MKKLYFILPFLILLSCRHEVSIIEQEDNPINDTLAQDTTSTAPLLCGFYLLNEGNMGSNKATIDYYDFLTGIYSRNIFASKNPNQVMELGDVGNDLKIYGSRLYAVINCSNKVEVMTADSAIRIGQIDIPNCRYLTFNEGYGYITSYAGPVQIGKEHAQIGYVAQFDTATLQITKQCLVGYQPDEIEVADGKLFVANSGGYMVPDYDSTISVIDIATMTEQKKITVAPNLHRIRKDKYNQLWITSRGDYYTQPARLYTLNPETLCLTDTLDFTVSDMWITGDSLYFVGTEFSWITMRDEVTYGIIDVKSHKLLTSSFITDGTDVGVIKPYGIAVNPINGDVYLTDAKTYVTPGDLYCFAQNGKKKWSIYTGDIPAHFAFFYK